jgi:hypothetical protein
MMGCRHDGQHNLRGSFWRVTATGGTRAIRAYLRGATQELWFCCR